MHTNLRVNRRQENSKATRLFYFIELSHNCLDMQPDPEITSDHTPIIATINNHQNCITAKQNWKH
jgi:hypothetical protein